LSSSAAAVAAAAAAAVAAAAAAAVEPNGMKRTHTTVIGSGSKLHLLRTGLVGCHLCRMRAEDRSETGLH